MAKMKHNPMPKKPVKASYEEPMRPKKPHSNAEKKFIDGKMKRKK